MSYFLGTVPPPLPAFPPPDHLPKKNIDEEILPYAEIGSKKDSQQVCHFRELL